MDKTTDKPPRKNDRSPENDLCKARDLCQTARGKFILAGFEEQGADVLIVIGKINELLGEV